VWSRFEGVQGARWVGAGQIGQQGRVPVRVAFGVQIRIAQYLDKVGTYLERGLLGTCRYRAVGR